MDRADITPALACQLIAAQFPKWARLPVRPVDLVGWDNTTFRLGDHLVVRLPSAEKYVAQVEKEHRWLPILAPQLGLPIPAPVARGRPGSGYPWPWSIYRWLDGEPATPERIEDMSVFAIDLARFLASLYTIDPTGGPLPGSHNFFRGGDLRTYDKQTRQCIALLAEQVDARFATEVWEAALSTVSRPSSVWVHGDVAPSNLLVSRGRLSAVIDFGCSAVGDPACDLAMAWTFFVGKSRAVFRNALDFDDETWARGRAWAMWKALSTLAQSEMNRADPDVAAQRFGWRGGPRDVIDEVFADHASSG